MLSELFSPFIEIINYLILKFSYVGIALVTVIENIIAPIPSEFVFPWAGFLAYQGKLNVFLIALSGAVGSVIAAAILYKLGSLFNGVKTREFVNKYGKLLFIKLEDLERAEKWFEKYGIWTVFIFRFIPIGRSIVSIPAGFVKMNFAKFIILTFAGTFIWSFILTYAGYVLGENWTLVSELTKKYEKLIIFIVLFLLFAFFLYKIRVKLKGKKTNLISEEK
jgi:membrane protein DedA with SNARE-associated domain